MKQKIIYFSAILANLILIGFAFFIFADAYGRERFFAILIALPGILSLLALYHGPDLEERRLKKRLLKANLRKDLKSLSEFDS